MPNGYSQWLNDPRNNQVQFIHVCLVNVVSDGWGGEIPDMNSIIKEQFLSIQQFKQQFFPMPSNPATQVILPFYATGIQAGTQYAIVFQLVESTQGGIVPSQGGTFSTCFARIVLARIIVEAKCTLAPIILILSRIFNGAIQ